MIEENNISPIRSDFEQIKKQNESGSEYWTSRDLCVALGYSTYQKFTRTINKAIAIASHKRLNIADHFNHMVEMVGYIKSFMTGYRNSLVYGACKFLIGTIA